jgi:peptidoglycan/LPS O-acetylase OafA/YrhL
MHTIIVTLAGFVLLGVLLGLTKPRDAGARRFIPVWLVLCVIHLGYGVLVAGYGLGEELGVHAVVFGLPAAVALVLSKTLKPKA